MRVAWSAGAQAALPRSKCTALVLNDEERNYCQDVFTRVGLLADAYDKLCSLSADYFEVREAMHQNQPGAGIDLSKVDPSVLQRERQWRSEVDQASSLFYYELKSVLDMLRLWGITVTGSELQYAARTRNWFLAHPQYAGVSRRSTRTISIPSNGRPVELSVSGLNAWTTVTREHYVSELHLTLPIDEKAQRALNEALVLNGKRTQQLTAKEILRLKAFGLREPRICDCANELAALLTREAVPKVATAFTEALTYGFERM